MEANSKKHRFRKGRSATFSIDGFNITIVANEDGENSRRPPASFSRSKSQSALWNAITAGMGIKDKEQKDLLNDPRSPEEILAEDPPTSDEPDATEKTAISRPSPQSLKLTPRLAAAAGSEIPADSPCEATSSMSSLTNRLMRLRQTKATATIFTCVWLLV
ncbi:Calcium/calmodulin-dependent 3',5'-cyclic nucleotide phosphodiesterase 1C [Oryzias melastigma]|uniref:Calcium/calmodulin-dependent 3',5'-cyclic nucleotide phosphodiesterase 1C n=1 Tax=Oryzias melastigma TaxID=30732 RepID=A0A834KW83_ORYME|nr:Calcium/calmodulin-dependent 3',5'-cyclic nucleotide phosphodiesterase 1C [Oryzias melastigma]